ncbi:Hypothetical Protein FCC1311_088982 [Hondaea fermentalgiana]|uniref:Uncharacterized protein n=1 Tax=Hondaea fermentalgiana TaxID=2315210 RepID=A0A2R5GVJ2_9STRA|nr:Hypothetical Protein FCC1311_088982 [Hondaea fermentalgiana]|eukprot:GBG32673.1 Hypothetical Protein FCC1311_088982 [Hondaea fermentalgiana]
MNSSSELGAHRRRDGDGDGDGGDGRGEGFAKVALKATRRQRAPRSSISSSKFLLPSFLLLASLAYVLRFALRVPEEVALPTCEAFPGLCGREISPGPAPANGESFGRWKAPVAAHLGAVRKLGSRLENFFQLKSWSYVSVSSPKYFLAITPVQFNYVEDIYLSVVDKTTRRLVSDFHWQMPFGRALKLAATSTDGCSKFVGWGQDAVELCFVGGVWHFNVNLTRVKAKIQIFKGAEALALWYPLGGDPKRPAYVHKEAGMGAMGSITVLDLPDPSSAKGKSAAPVRQAPHIFKEGAATIDWTLTRALRETKWQWVSLSCAACSVQTWRAPFQKRSGIAATQSMPVGINLSRLVYDVQGPGTTLPSAENALWLDHKVHALPVAVAVDMPSNGPLQGPWVIRANETGVVLHLEFQPHGLREDHTGSDVVGIVSDFVQPYGSFSGFLEVQNFEQGVWHRVDIENVYGVCENHRAVW